MNFQIHTFGCKVNTYDSGLIQKNLQGHEVKSDPATKIHVLNTCAVTAEATKEAVRVIRKIKSKEPFATVVVTGCAAQVDTESFQNLSGADLVVANSHKGLLPQILEQYFKGEIKSKVFKSNIFRKEDLEAGGGEELNHTRSFLKIQDGCNSFCTYCIIPYARGKSRSILVRELVKRIQELERTGVQEVVLTGVHIGDYEDPTFSASLGLEGLVEELLKRTKMPRFRLSSLEPVELTDRLVDLYADERMCPHFHMSIQSAETTTLQQMKRKYGQDDVRQALEKIARRVPGAFVGMDVIAGFPSESEAQFEETFQTLAELPWTKIHVFPYSERPGTRAALIADAVPWSERLQRARQLRELSLHRYQSEGLKQKGQMKKVLILKNQTKNSQKEIQGLSRDYWNVLWPATDLTPEISSSLIPGTEVEVKIAGFYQDPTKMDGVLTL